MVDVHEAHSEDIMWLKNKVADLEDRFRRNNIKISGVSDDIPQDQLMQYAHTLFYVLFPSLTPMDLLIDRIHRLSKPSFLPQEVPRDVLLRIQFSIPKKRSYWPPTR